MTIPLECGGIHLSVHITFQIVLISRTRHSKTLGLNTNHGLKHLSLLINNKNKKNSGDSYNDTPNKYIMPTFVRTI